MEIEWIESQSLFVFASWNGITFLNLLKCLLNISDPSSMATTLRHQQHFPVNLSHDKHLLILLLTITVIITLCVSVEDAMLRTH